MGGGKKIVNNKKKTLRKINEMAASATRTRDRPSPEEMSPSAAAGVARGERTTENNFY
jgi:hypothetical protein